MFARKLNPMRLASWAMIGANIAASAWFLSFLPIPRLPVNGHGIWAVLWAYRLRSIVYFGPFVVGLSISLWAERRFGRGFRDDIWTEAELESVRALLANPVWTWAACAQLAAAVALVAGQHAGMGGFVYILLLPLQAAARLRKLVSPRLNDTASLGLRDFKRLRSDHWGEPTHSPGLGTNPQPG